MSHVYVRLSSNPVIWGGIVAILASVVEYTTCEAHVYMYGSIFFYYAINKICPYRLQAI